MEYYSILSLNREPFSNSPDPRFFFHSRQHHECLNKLEISIRLKRGLCVVLGEVGTGKSTLCRELVRRLAEDQRISPHVIMDPLYASDIRFLSAVSETITGIEAGDADEWTLKERIKHHLFQEGVEKGRTVTLIIDEGQKIRQASLEYLREFLNYETNDHKLVQIVIFAQREFADVVNTYPNLADRVNLTYWLGPLSLMETTRMVRFRLELASNQAKPPALFTPLALWAIHRATKGYPRRIIHLCHHCLLTMIIQNKSRVDARTVAFCARRHKDGRLIAPYGRWTVVLSGMLLALVFAVPTFHWVVRPPTSTQETVPTHALPRVEAPSTAMGQETLEVDTFKATESAPVRHLAEAPLPTGAREYGAVPSDDQSRPQEEVLLGVVTVLPGESLSSIIRRVYGTFRTPMLQHVMRANPQLTHPDTLFQGDLLRIPAVSVPVEQQSGPHYWVQVAETQTLQSAVSLLREYPPSAPSVHLVPFSTGQDGFRFRIVLRQPAGSRDEAVKLKGLVPQAWGYRPLIFDQWPHDTVFFADPYR